MYSRSSESYWQASQKRKTGKDKLNKRINVLLFMSILVLITRILFSRGRDENDRIPVRKPCPDLTEADIIKCSSHFKIARGTRECSDLCRDARQMVPRPVMYQSCVHGCSGALYSAAINGCSGGSREENIQQLAQHGYKECAKYQNILPKPDIFTQCRKQYGLATERGYELGRTWISELLQKKCSDTQHSSL